MNTKNYFLSLAALMMMFGLTSKTNAQYAVKSFVKSSVNVNETFSLFSKGAIMIDVREVDEVAEISYSIKTVVNMPLSTLENNFSLISKDTHIILACRSGNRSQKAYNLLKDKGYYNITNMEGGMLAWEEADLPVSRVENVKTEGTEKSLLLRPKQ